MYCEVHDPKSLISKIFEPFLKSCTSEVHVPRGRVPRGLTVVVLPYKVNSPFRVVITKGTTFKSD